LPIVVGRPAAPDPTEETTLTSPSRALCAEDIGSLLLFATVIGSGIMGERLSGGNVAVALLGNTAATGAMLFVLISMLGPASGAHFNPVVTLVMRLRGGLSTRMALAYGAAQLAGGIAGVWVAHAMFALQVWQVSHHLRSGLGQWLGEGVATFGLLFTILLSSQADQLVDRYSERVERNSPASTPVEATAIGMEAKTGART
jgi:glycerol uptake facilitator-like aquaporin